jgi:gliding motility-associated-like protein
MQFTKDQRINVTVPLFMISLPVGIVTMEFFRVFDRWGKLVYSTTAYLQGWDGTVNGQTAGVGTYVWVVQGKDITNNTVQRKGTVTLVR